MMSLTKRNSGRICCFVIFIHTKVVNKQVLQCIVALLEVDDAKFEECFRFKKSFTRGEQIVIPYNMEEARRSVNACFLVLMIVLLWVILILSVIELNWCDPSSSFENIIERYCQKKFNSFHPERILIGFETRLIDWCIDDIMCFWIIIWFFTPNKQESWFFGENYLFFALRFYLFWNQQIIELPEFWPIKNHRRSVRQPPLWITF